MRVHCPTVHLNEQSNMIRFSGARAGSVPCVRCRPPSQALHKARRDAGVHSTKVRSQSSEEVKVKLILLSQREEHPTAGVLLARPSALHEKERELDLLPCRLSRRSVADNRFNLNPLLPTF